jgi:hypothetical protein
VSLEDLDVVASRLGGSLLAGDMRDREEAPPASCEIHLTRSIWSA